jgi:hypothetical protein
MLPDYITGKLLGIAECFSSGCSGAVLQTTRTVAVSVRTLSAAGLSFYVRLIPGIKSWLITTEAQASLVEEYGMKATECLRASYNEIVKDKEDVIIEPVDNEPAKRHVEAISVSKDTSEDIVEVLSLREETVECLPTSLLDRLSDGISRSGKATLDQKDVDFPGSRRQICRDCVRP